MDINLELRSKIVECSLNIEKCLNDLILLSLGIFNEGNTTRLFSDKGIITFKNKIDLLYDIDILSKEENQNLELLMNFRNKFLHLIECNSFLTVLQKMDNGLKNRFKIFLEEGHSIENEKSCEVAFNNLYEKNMDAIQSKVLSIGLKLYEKKEFLDNQSKQSLYFMNLFFDLVQDITLIAERLILGEINNNNVADNILELINLYDKKLAESDTQEEYKNGEKNLNIIKELFGIKKIRE